MEALEQSLQAGEPSQYYSAEGLTHLKLESEDQYANHRFWLQRIAEASRFFNEDDSVDDLCSSALSVEQQQNYLYSYYSDFFAYDSNTRRWKQIVSLGFPVHRGES